MTPQDGVPRIRVVVADDNADVRRLLHDQLELGGLAVVGEAADGDEAIRVVERLRPDVVVLDLEMGRMSGASALPGIRSASPRSSVVVFSWFPDPFTLAQVLTMGADLYVDKAEGPAKLVEHLRALVAMVAIPAEETDEDRLATVRGELDALHQTARGRRLLPAERRRYAHLLMIEARLLHRQNADATAQPALSGSEIALRGWREGMPSAD